MSCWNCCVESEVVRTVMLGAAVCGRCVEDRCVEGYSGGGCGNECCCEGRVYTNNVVGDILGGLNGCYYRTIGLCSLRVGYFGTV